MKLQQSTIGASQLANKTPQPDIKVSPFG